MSGLKKSAAEVAFDQVERQAQRGSAWWQRGAGPRGSYPDTRVEVAGPELPFVPEDPSLFDDEAPDTERSPPPAFEEGLCRT